MDQTQDNTSATPLWGPSKRRLRTLLLGAGERPNVVEAAKHLSPIIEQHADVVLQDLEFAQDLSQVEADLAIVLGGDGAILRSAKQMATNQIPVLGVNLGNLGFLADIQPDELPKVLPAVCLGKCRIISHLMFQCSVIRGGEVLHAQLGLNEMAILGGPPFSILNIELYVDSELATTYSCDGLIISTPVGSTAHSLSAGGPILRKNLQAFVILPISPHTITVRPVVDTADRIYEAVVPESPGSASVVVDGHVLCNLAAGDRVRVERAEPEFKMIEVIGHNYYTTLHEKLGWGGNLRDKQ